MTTGLLSPCYTLPDWRNGQNRTKQILGYEIEYIYIYIYIYIKMYWNCDNARLPSSRSSIHQRGCTKEVAPKRVHQRGCTKEGAPKRVHQRGCIKEDAPKKMHQWGNPNIMGRLRGPTNQVTYQTNESMKEGKLTRTQQIWPSKEGTPKLIHSKEVPRRGHT